MAAPARVQGLLCPVCREEHPMRSAGVAEPTFVAMSCPVCLQERDNAARLPCGHLLCVECVEHLRASGFDVDIYIHTPVPGHYERYCVAVPRPGSSQRRLVAVDLEEGQEHTFGLLRERLSPHIEDPEDDPEEQPEGCGVHPSRVRLDVRGLEVNYREEMPADLGLVVARVSSDDAKHILERWRRSGGALEAWADFVRNQVAPLTVPGAILDSPEETSEYAEFLRSLDRLQMRLAPPRRSRGGPRPVDDTDLWQLLDDMQKAVQQQNTTIATVLEEVKEVLREEYGLDTW